MKTIINKFLCSKELHTTTKGLDILYILTTYLKMHGLSWDSCVKICTDGAPSVVGSIKGFASLMGKQIHNIV